VGRPTPPYVRAATPEDALGIARVHVGAWQVAYRGIVPTEHLDRMSVTERESRWKPWLEGDNPGVLVAEDAEEVVGFISLGPGRDEGVGAEVGEVYAVYVSPKHWSTGVGRALWTEARRKLAQGGFRQVRIWVLGENHRARRFYEAAGLSLGGAAQKVEVIGGVPLVEVQYVIELEPGAQRAAPASASVQIHLRDAVDADSDFVFHAFREAIGPYVEAFRGWDPRQELERHLRRWSGQQFRVIVADGSDAGYLSTTIHRQPSGKTPAGLHLHNLMILPAFQSRGIGSACFQRLRAEARALELPVRLRVLRVNPRALAFYLREECEVVSVSESHTWLQG
jgi:GNAT superfamily N-acetyltransferase